MRPRGQDIRLARSLTRESNPAPSTHPNHLSPTRTASIGRAPSRPSSSPTRPAAATGSLQGSSSVAARSLPVPAGGVAGGGGGPAAAVGGGGAHPAPPPGAG